MNNMKQKYEKSNGLLITDGSIDYPKTLNYYTKSLSGANCTPMVFLTIDYMNWIDEPWAESIKKMLTIARSGIFTPCLYNDSTGYIDLNATMRRFNYNNLPVYRFNQLMTNKGLFLENVSEEEWEELLTIVITTIPLARIALRYNCPIAKHIAATFILSK